MALVCTECGAAIDASYKSKLTCSPKCRKRRERRRYRERHPGKQHEARDAVITSTALKDAVSKELAPVVREALTEEVLTAAKGLIRLTPKAIARLEEDLDGDDPTIRQRAYQTVVKIVGHPALMPEKATEDPQLTVHFNLPRPDGMGVSTDVVELKQCDFCGESKPLDEFVGASDRCTKCYESLQRQAQELLNANGDS
jgi:predicted  nucleic acid-binding Zn-ribbon protein